MPAGYFDRQKQPISKGRWKELCGNEGYSILKRFRDDRVHIEARWVGKLDDASSHFPYLRPVFALLVFNRTADGSWVQDPMHGTRFSDERKLLEEYDKFLLSWTETTLNEDGELEEVGNQLEAPEESSNSPGAPRTTDAKNLVGVDAEIAAAGAW